LGGIWVEQGHCFHTITIDKSVCNLDCNLADDEGFPSVEATMVVNGSVCDDDEHGSRDESIDMFEKPMAIDESVSAVDTPVRVDSNACKVESSEAAEAGYDLFTQC